MKKFSLVEFSVGRPRLVVAIVVLITLGFLTQFPKIKTDTNPKNMLPPTSDVRVWNDEVDETFALYEDMIAVGVVNDEGVLNERTLGKVLRITDEVLRIEGVAARDVNGLPTITNVTAEAGTLKVAPLMAEVPATRAEMEGLRKDLTENPL
ncbi:MAG: RND transporter, partial [Deltaproteobacteria bacterium]|nr:RND transporter [Deltaproteobacteria bacterium]